MSRSLRRREEERTNRGPPIVRFERETSEEPRIIAHEVLNDRSLMNSRSFREPQAGRAKVAKSIIFPMISPFVQHELAGFKTRTLSRKRAWTFKKNIHGEPRVIFDAVNMQNYTNCHFRVFTASKYNTNYISISASILLYYYVSNINLRKLIFELRKL